MGNEQSNAPKNVDKRTARREHRLDFEYAIREFRQHPTRFLPAFASSTAPVEDNIKVCVRKRPQFPREIKAGEFDVVAALDARHLAVSDGRMEADMVHMFVTHNLFPFDQVFDQNASNEHVYENTARSLVEEAVGGGLATCFMYGQTGSGKTHTMTAIQQLAAEDLFRLLHAKMGTTKAAEKKEAESKTKASDSVSVESQYAKFGFDPLDPSMPDAAPLPDMLAAMKRAMEAEQKAEKEKERKARESDEAQFTVSVAFFEIAGTQCYDLLNKRELVHLRQDEHGKVHVRGVTELAARNAAELIRHVRAANKARASLATSANPTGSSRSHAVCRIFVRFTPPSKLGVRFPAERDCAEDKHKASSPERDDEGSEWAPRKQIKPTKGVAGQLKMKGSKGSGKAASPVRSPSRRKSSIQGQGRSRASSISAASLPASVQGPVVRSEDPADGELTLVDLAGSERNEDSKDHDAERRKQCAEINSSLMCLKDCVRMRVEQLKSGSADRDDSHIPFRRSKLTQLLKDAFTLPRARTVVIATVSPNSTDTEHTLNTLLHAAMMKAADGDITQSKKIVVDEAPESFEEEKLREAAARARAAKPVPSLGLEQKEKETKRDTQRETEKENKSARSVASQPRQSLSTRDSPVKATHARSVSSHSAASKQQQQQPPLFRRVSSIGGSPTRASSAKGSPRKASLKASPQPKLKPSPASKSKGPAHKRASSVAQPQQKRRMSAASAPAPSSPLSQLQHSGEFSGRRISAVDEPVVQAKQQPRPKPQQQQQAEREDKETAEMRRMIDERKAARAERSEKPWVNPNKWAPQEVHAWLQSMEAHGTASLKGCAARLPSGTTGAQFVRFPRARFVQLCDSDQGGDILFKALHREMQRGSEKKTKAAKAKVAVRKSRAVRS